MNSLHVTTRSRHHLHTIALVVWLLFASAAYSQVAITQVCVVRSTVPIPAGARFTEFLWKADKAVTVTRNAGRDSASMTGPAGTYQGTLTIAVATAETLELAEHQFTFTICVASEPGPGPPQPTPATLRSLVDAPTAALLAEFYADLSEGVRLGTDPAVATFWATHDTFYKAMREKHKLPSNPTLGVALTKAINGLLDGATTIDAPLRKSLSDGLLALASEFGTPSVPPVPDEPTTPLDEKSTPIVHDGFRVLFVEEGTTREPWFDILTSTSNVLAYLDSHVTDGKAGWRKWDQNEDAENAPAPLKELVKVPRPGINCIVLTKGKRAYVYQLTNKTKDEELMAILKKFGGE